MLLCRLVERSKENKEGKCVNLAETTVSFLSLTYSYLKETCRFYFLRVGKLKAWAEESSSCHPWPSLDSLRSACFVQWLEYSGFRKVFVLPSFPSIKFKFCYWIGRFCKAVFVLFSMPRSLYTLLHPFYWRGSRYILSIPLIFFCVPI